MAQRTGNTALTFDDLPRLTDWSLWELERFVRGKCLDSAVAVYLGNAWRVVATSEHLDPDDPGSACAGYISLEPPPPEAIELGRQLAREGKFGPGSQDLIRRIDSRVRFFARGAVA